jgi:dolichol-phosphate mannosyltransferase
MKVSAILPTYNGADNIIELVKKIIDNIPSDWDYEIIVVDDNSPEQTFDIVKEAYQDNPAVISLLRTKDRGFAKPIRAGIDVARGDQILVMCTD